MFFCHKAFKFISRNYNFTNCASFRATIKMPVATSEEATGGVL